MQFFEVLEKLGSLDSAVFTVSDIQRITNFKNSYLKVFLSRLLRKKVLFRVTKGKYVLKNTDPFLVASQLFFPSYITGLSALFIHKATSQIPKNITVATNRSLNDIPYANYIIKFIKLKPRMLFGFEKIKYGSSYLFLADFEKTVIDSLRLRLVDEDEIETAIRTKGINKERLFNYLKRINSGTLNKNISELLERCENAQ